MFFWLQCALSENFHAKKKKRCLLYFLNTKHNGAETDNLSYLLLNNL